MYTGKNTISICSNNTEVHSAHWIKEYLGYGVTRYRCSACDSIFGADAIEDLHHNKYCADCGCKMTRNVAHNNMY